MVLFVVNHSAFYAQFQTANTSQIIGFHRILKLNCSAACKISNWNRLNGILKYVGLAYDPTISKQYLRHKKFDKFQKEKITS